MPLGNNVIGEKAAKVTIIEFSGHNTRLLDSYLWPFVISFTIVSLVFGAVLFLIGRVLSARIAGPLYAFEKFLDDLANGKPRKLKLRAGDEFKHLEQLALRLTQALASVQPPLPIPADNVAPLPIEKPQEPIAENIEELIPKKTTGTS